MNTAPYVPRIPEFGLDPFFTERWSPRAFRSSPLPREQLLSLFEASRWSPSSYNDQPWVFCYADSPAERERFAVALAETNRRWACRAPVLAYLACRTHFRHNGKPNPHASFDSGAAWMALAFRARQLGLYTHAMAGFDRQQAHAILHLPSEKFDILAAFVIGSRGDPNELPEDLRDIEYPNQRQKLHTMVFAGPYQESADEVSAR